MSKKRIVHYINNFFAGAGGEEAAGMEPEFREGATGPGLALSAGLWEKTMRSQALLSAETTTSANIPKEATDTILSNDRSSINRICLSRALHLTPDDTAWPAGPSAKAVEE